MKKDYSQYTWDELNKLFSLRPIKNIKQHKLAVEVVRELALLKKLTKDQRDYFDVLSDIIVKYEKKRGW